MQMHSYLVLMAAAAASLATGLSIPRSGNTGLNVVPATYDGSCYYPVPDPRFQLQRYLGIWYQVAGTPFRETQGARCVTAEYQANDNGTVKVINTAQAGGRTISVIGTAKPAGLQYGFSGVFQVEFPQSTGFECPGPNYIVQEYGGDYAIVQTQNWGVLYVLSRERQPPTSTIDSWIERAVCLGSNATAISYYDQTDC